MSSPFEEWLVEQRGVPRNREFLAGGAIAGTLLLGYLAKIPSQDMVVSVVLAGVGLAILGYERVALGESLGNRRWLDAVFHAGLIGFFAGLFPLLDNATWTTSLGLCTVAASVYSGLLLPRFWFLVTSLALFWPLVLAGEHLVPYLMVVSFSAGGGLLANTMAHTIVDRSIAMWRRDGLNRVQQFAHARLSAAEPDSVLVPLSYDSTERALSEAMDDIRACYPHLEVTYNATAGDPLTLGGSGALAHVLGAMLRYFAVVHGDAPRPKWAKVTFQADLNSFQATLAVEGDRLYERPEDAARFGAAGAETQVDWDIVEAYARGLGVPLLFESAEHGGARMAVRIPLSREIVECEDDEIEDPKAEDLEKSLLR